MIFKTVKELADYLNTLPPETKVDVVSCCEQVNADECIYVEENKIVIIQ